MGCAILGIDPTRVSATQEFRLGTVGGLDSDDGYKEYIYGRANGAITAAGQVVVEQGSYDFALASTTTTAAGSSGHGSRVGVAAAVMADNDYGWFQIYGQASIDTAANAAAGTRLNSTGTGGRVDDDGSIGAEAINGMVLRAATGGAAAVNTSGRLSYPTVGATL